MQGWYVLVTGPPASGKSTVAPALARELRVPLIAKDTIKDALVEVLPAPDIEASRSLGAAAVAAMFAVAAAADRAVLESVLRPESAARVLALGAPVVEVFCRAPEEVCRQRFLERARSPRAGYFDDVRTGDELWHPDISEPVAGGWPVLEVDTCQPFDPRQVAASVLELLGRPAQRGTAP